VRFLARLPPKASILPHRIRAATRSPIRSRRPSIQDPTKSATATVTVSSSLVGWWPLNEGTEQWPMISPAKATMAHGAARPVLRSVFLTNTTGRMGSVAGYFNGNDNSLTIGTQPIYDFTGPFTDFYVDQSREFEPSQGFSARENFNNNGNNGYLLALYPSHPKFCLEANDGTRVACVDGSGSASASGRFSRPYTTAPTCPFTSTAPLSSQVGSALTPPAINASLVFGTPEQGGQGMF